ncbi:MAG: HAMP domain-containing sensor histidine kinase [Elusimicrobiales bacterium]|nr:HAMP domain-containing sensor histidine kinase [Elusimicrobiales bacterium]
MNSSSKSSPCSGNSRELPAAAEGLAESLYWLIRLRWFAVAGIFFTALLARGWLGLRLPYGAVLGVAAGLGVCNYLLLIYLDRSRAAAGPGLARTTNRLANAQIPLDLLCLTALVHLTGGVENPFSYYFVFHMIIASVLLSRRASYLQAAFALLLYLLLAGLEYTGAWPHHCAASTPALCLRGDFLHLLGSCAAFGTTLFIAVYMASSISHKLRQKEAHLRAANEQLREKDKIKSNYVLRVTHDIKEHLAAIQACLDPVLHGVTGPVPPAQESLIRRSYERTGKLMLFVKALLEITRIKLSRKMETADFSLLKTAESAVSHVLERAKARNIRLTWTVNPGVDEVHGSQIYIEETIAGFLANAVKYTPEGGSVELTIGDAGASVLIRVTDTGMGIPEDELPRIFEEFYRARNAKAAERTGTGLGLSIAREVALRHKGRVWAESEEGKGSAFYFALPKRAAA